ncbi:MULTISPECIES: GNAT family N-acetyltransferase [unclassified Erythrobacter]|uniref:GNAT family N-acetyltransferase n=1 Tax=unclassified Erythrobacter TaxID=2633097 RepID=UPI0009EDED77|nr:MULTISPECIES: GNAT family N-acetyltransferase [unclassified Erythrobacter]
MARWFFNTQAYLELESERVGGNPEIVFQQGEYCLGFIRRGIPAMTYEDGVSVYGGPSLAVGSLTAADALRAFQGALDARPDQPRIVSLFLRGAVGEYLPELQDFPSRMEKIGDSVVIPLNCDADEIFSGFRKKQRYELRKGEQFTVSQCDDVEGFHRVYTQSMHRTEARPEYFFSEDYLRRLMRIPGSHLYSIRDGGNLLCSAIFLEQHPFLVYHLSGTATHALHRSPMRSLIAYVAMTHAHGPWQGLSLGGGVGGGNDTLLRFKQGFSKATLPVHGLKIVTNPDVYARIANTGSVDANQLAGFFPAYRAPEKLMDGERQ